VIGHQRRVIRQAHGDAGIPPLAAEGISHPPELGPDWACEKAAALAPSWPRLVRPSGCGTASHAVVAHLAGSEHTGHVTAEDSLHVGASPPLYLFPLREHCWTLSSRLCTGTMPA